LETYVKILMQLALDLLGNEIGRKKEVQFGISRKGGHCDSLEGNVGNVGRKILWWGYVW
jgi:hypothetical protein